jgi:Flp pilus assembly protein TadG
VTRSQHPRDAADQESAASRSARTVSGPDEGAAAVEMALVVPFLLLIVFGIVNFGFIFSSQISLNSAARDAARAGVVQPFQGSGLTCGAIASAARANSGTIGAPATNVAVTVTGPDGTSCSLAAGAASATGSATSLPCVNSSSAPGQLVVALSYGYHAPMPLVLPASTTLTSTGKFQCEYS